MSVAAALTLLVCPACGGTLSERDGLVCLDCGRHYPVRDGVPVLFPPGSDDAHAVGRLRSLYHDALARPRVYDFLQRHGGGVPIAARVQETLADTPGGTVLDVGAGTGMVHDVLPSGATYIWLDNDRLKLRGFRRKDATGLTVLGDATSLPFGDDTIDVVTMVEVAHHLPDEALSSFLREAARVARQRFVLVDGLRTPRLRSRALWAFDLGRYPRTRAELDAALTESFDVRTVTTFRVNHDHVIYECSPRAH